MAIERYLAMTGAEMASAAALPKKTAWMACHFSPYSTGLCNFPAALPKESLLILNDRTPICGHDPERVCRELKETISKLNCSGLLVDFLNPPNRESLALTRYLAANLPFSLGLPPEYAAEGCAVFVPAVPTLTPVSQYLSRWQGREIWLELALGGQAVALKADGAHFGENRFPRKGIIHTDDALHCHYVIEEQQDAFIFHTWRTAEDLDALLEDAGQIKFAVGLYQELAARPKVSSFPPAGG